MKVKQWTKAELKLMKKYIKLKGEVDKVRKKLLKTRKISAINMMYSITKK